MINCALQSFRKARRESRIIVVNLSCSEIFGGLRVDGGGLSRAGLPGLFCFPLSDVLLLLFFGRRVRLFVIDL